MKNAAHDRAAPAANSGELDNHRQNTPEAAPATHRARTLPRAVVIARWQKNPRGEQIELQLKPFDRANLVDLRTHVRDRRGGLEPSRGFNCTVDHIPRLRRAFADAERLAIRLGLIDGSE